MSDSSFINNCSFGVTGFFNGVRCIGTVSSSKRGFMAECFQAENPDASLGNPAFFQTYEEAEKAIKGAIRA